jgi:hypothetical protein
MENERREKNRSCTLQSLKKKSSASTRLVINK